MYGLYESEFILVVGWLVVCMYVCISVQRAKVYIVYKLAQERSCACTESCWPFYWLAQNHAGHSIGWHGIMLAQLFVQLGLSVISICLLA